MYELVLTRDAQKFYERADSPLARRLNRCFENLGENPYNHPNIKRLRGTLSGYLRFRVIPCFGAWLWARRHFAGVAWLWRAPGELVRH